MLPAAGFGQSREKSFQEYACYSGSFSGEPGPIVNFNFHATKWRPVVKYKSLDTITPPNSVTLMIEDFRFIVVTEFSTHRSTPPTFSF